MATEVFATTPNNGRSTLDGAHDNSTVTINVASAANLGVDGLTGSDFAYADIVDINTLGQSSETLETVKITAVTANALTVVRGQDGTSGTAFADGDIIECRILSVHYQHLVDALTDGLKDLSIAALAYDGDLTAGSSAVDTTWMASLSPTEADLSNANDATLVKYQPGSHTDVGVRGPSVQFVTAANKYSHFYFLMPQDYDGRALVVRLYWGTTTGSGDVKWDLYHKSYGDSDTLIVDESLSGTIGPITADTAKDLNIDEGTYTPATSTAGQLQHLVIRRNGANGTDTHSDSAYLVAVEIAYS